MISAEEKGTFSLHKIRTVVAHFGLSKNPIYMKEQVPGQFTRHTIYIDSGSSQFTPNQRCYHKNSSMLTLYFNENSDGYCSSII